MSKPPALPANAETADTVEHEMEEILQTMLEADEEISARGVVRRHSHLKAASSITRSTERMEILGRYKARQEEFRNWQRRLARKQNGVSALTLADKDLHIAALENQVSLLVHSHVTMLRVIGELGGMAKWSQFYESFKSVRDQLTELGAMPKD